MYDWLAYFVLAGLIYTVGSRWISRLGAPDLAGVLRTGLLLRIFGTVFRYEVMMFQYGHPGDSLRYYQRGLEYVESLWALDYRVITEFAEREGRAWGTPVVDLLSGIVLSVIGPSMRGEYLVFASAGYIGLAAGVLAFREMYGKEAAARYGRWVLWWPSLWFWPVSVGKESIMLLCAGLAMWGYVGRAGRPRWPWVGFGVGFILLIRPHIALVLGFALLFAEMTQGQKAFQGRNLLRLLGVSALAVVVTQQAGGSLGMDATDLNSVQEQFEMYAGRTQSGGSQTTRASGLAGIPMAFVNVLLRPFPWEARHVFALAAGVEVWAFWYVLFTQRARLRPVLLRWREQRILRFALPFTVLIVLMFGFGFSNMGILTRQRVVILPFLFLLMAARWPGPKPASKLATAALGRAEARAAIPAGVPS